ncbi:hypothetical protein [Youngiibacter multivorans]|uniref:Uncharacterized protein n=1 Tax=Youngiibacter multivorans TaxID=937251 RepID=A0ABS4G6X7_9CLOT|nr:hypothetical protein [Youngiibacter multivorans]MBP1920311.1 hypothetical protein [Youngiibacter multivorans]
MAELLTIQNLILSGASLFLGALLSSYFSWLYFKKQKRAEIQIDEAKAIHNQIFKVNAQFAEIHDLLIKYKNFHTSNNQKTGLISKEELLNRMNVLANELFNTGKLFNYAKYILNVNTKAIAKLNNDWVAIFEQEIESQQIEIDRVDNILNFIKQAEDILNDENLRIIYISNSNIYTSLQKLKYILNAYKDTNNKRKQIPKCVENALIKFAAWLD